MLKVAIINILYYENLFFLTHYLQISYVQNSFYNWTDGAFYVSKKLHIFPIST
ncbi:hypothetical protein DF16_orf03251 [Bacillus thuringiensis serovar kurstaki str. YBT-1520]|uniref:Uncharacterized protein n=1 Tax=Bacillus cereus (strain G9842) TaxID=405531 RepID=B7ILL2_BACC2|nr:hypothetical protein BCG9842_B2241 [Bacillus cereus G9842]AIM31666.1 hypothetical protein DF16_orf03251 [Bacillus thuringiensis serovar kurstaki str. YBT-1520]EEL55524.1 hypothetical protein bcere0023_28180 [Bacillus cereus Rock4-2]EEM52923.1 hypothetical protein bthur0006_27030 [Bacillus thuringiensis serovar kurstaki str. T03a001]